jgi:hypothetical protein
MAIKKRPIPRAAQVFLDHDLPDYQPKTGDIVMAFHLFNEFDEAEDTLRKRANGTEAVSSLKTRKEEVAKFRPCLVVHAKGNEAMLVPVSSRRDQNGRHLEINEPDELKSLGLAPHKPAYARTMGLAKYDCAKNPLILPVAGEDGKPSWTLGQAPRELVAQSVQDVVRQKKHGRLKHIPTRFARDVPPLVVEEMNRLASEARKARAARTPKRAIPKRTDNGSQVSDPEMQRRMRALMAHQLREKAAAKAAKASSLDPHPRKTDQEQL